MDIVQGRFEIIGPRSRPLSKIPEEGSAGQVTARVAAIIRTPREDEDNAVRASKSDRAVRTDVEAAIELQKIGDIDRRESHTGKAAIGMIESS